MRIMVVKVLVVAAILLGQASLSLAQPAGAPDWNSLTAEEFNAASSAVLSATPTTEERSALATVAWARFLSRAEFVATADIETVLELVANFGDGGPEGGAGVAELQAALQARVDADASGLAGTDLYMVGNAAKAMWRGGQPATETAPLFVKWKDANLSWRSLENHHLYNLFGFLNADAVDRRSFSARWTGMLTAPLSADYTFRQAQVYSGANSKLKIWIDGEEVLDTSTATDNDDFASRTVSLDAGEPVSFQVELVHEAPEIVYSVGAPMALVTWETPGRDRELIPTEALELPAKHVAEATYGLWGEYFADTSFGDLKVSRVDPTLDHVWTWPPAAAAETKASREVFAAIVERLTSDAYLREAAAGTEDARRLEFDRNLWRIAYRMSGAERLQLVDALLRNPDMLAGLSPEAIGRLYRGLYMLPGDSHWVLLGEWALAAPQPRTQPGWFPGWGRDSYEKLNTGFYWAIGHMMQGPYAETAKNLTEDYLVRPDGECNLAVAYVAAFAAAENGSGRELLELITEQIDSAALRGNQRATWYIARAGVTGILSGRPLPAVGFEDLQTAQLIADDDEYSFWALQEMAGRLCALGDADAVQKLVDVNRDRFTTPVRQQQLSGWLTKAESYAQRMEDRAANDLAQQEQGFLEELQRRRDAAASRGDSDTVERYETAIKQRQDELLSP